MDITLRKIQESDFPGLIYLFQEFTQFEKLPEKMTNNVDQLKLEKDYIKGFVALSDSDEILGYVTYLFLCLLYLEWKIDVHG